MNRLYGIFRVCLVGLLLSLPLTLANVGNALESIGVARSPEIGDSVVSIGDFHIALSTEGDRALGDGIQGEETPYWRFYIGISQIVIDEGVFIGFDLVEVWSFNVKAVWVAPDDGSCSLREAVEVANTDTVIDVCRAHSRKDTLEFLGTQYLTTCCGTVQVPEPPVYQGTSPNTWSEISVRVLRIGIPTGIEIVSAYDQPFWAPLATRRAPASLNTRYGATMASSPKTLVRMALMSHPSATVISPRELRNRYLTEGTY